MISKKQIKYKRFIIQPLALIGLLLLLTQLVQAQLPGVLGRIPGSMPSSSSGGGGHDSLTFVHRNDAADYVTMGNTGTAAFPVLFTPILKAGWDAGFHAYDLYKYTIENTRFYKTTRPFTQLTYLLGTGKEQVIDVLQTQNIKPNWNAGIDYRLISSPGLFQTQNANHNNYRFFSNYQGKKKRYAAYFVLLGNKLNSSENGGIQNDSLLADPTRKNRVAIPVNLGGDIGLSYNIFSTAVNNGNLYSNFTAFFRQCYDFGIKDSLIIND